MILLQRVSSVSSDLGPSKFLLAMGAYSSPGKGEIAEPTGGRKALRMLRVQVGVPC